MKKLLGFKVDTKNMKKGDYKDLRNIFADKGQKCYRNGSAVYITAATNSLKKGYNKYKRLLEIKMYLQQFGLDKLARPVRF